jgi:peptide/nickel transport system substrate-binding protein
MCVDRQAMVDEILFGRSEVMHTYLPAVHPLFAGDDVPVWPYDVAAANVLLDEVGYTDDDEDGVRESAALGTPFALTLYTTTANEMRQQVAQHIQTNLSDCGIEVQIIYLSPEELFADGPNGPLFGRRFDMAAFGWPVGMTPPCDFYVPAQIPSAENGWSGQNETGWVHEEFAAACLAALALLPGTAEYETDHQIAQRIFAEQLPVLPLFPRLKVAITRPEVCNFMLDSTQASELYNLFEIGLNNCQ